MTGSLHRVPGAGNSQQIETIIKKEPSPTRFKARCTSPSGVSSAGNDPLQIEVVDAVRDMPPSRACRIQGFPEQPQVDIGALS